MRSSCGPSLSLRQLQAASPTLATQLSRRFPLHFLRNKAWMDITTYNMMFCPSSGEMMLPECPENIEVGRHHQL